MFSTSLPYIMNSWTKGYQLEAAHSTKGRVPYIMTPGKDQIVLHASEEFKDRLGKYAQANDLSMAEVIRRAVAAVIDYDLSAEPARSRTPKYATPEEAKRAALDRAALIRWGNSTSGRLLVNGEIEAASVIARAVAGKDYETLTLLKDAAEENANNDDD